MISLLLSLYLATIFQCISYVVDKLSTVYIIYIHIMSPHRVFPINPGELAWAHALPVFKISSLLETKMMQANVTRQ